MSRTVIHSREVVPAPEQESPKPEEIRHQLRAILASPAFHGSKRCQQFLEYVCEKSLSGSAAVLKERTLAVEVFGRRPQSDLAEDTIVRVSAREVRKRLVQYYISAEGVTAEIRIDLPSGSYAPEFRYAGPHQEVAAPELPLELPRWRFGIAAAGVIAIIALAAAAAIYTSKTTSAARGDYLFTRFWEPVFHSREPLLIVVANPLVYHPSTRALRLSEENLPPPDVPLQRAIQVPADKLDGSDMVPVFNQYVGFGDMIAATELSSMLARNSKNVRVRMSSAVEFADLRQTQALLIGAITNRWTMQLQQAWRFQFNWTPDVRNFIVDTSSQNRQEWSIPAKDDGSTPEDYILICRVRDSVTGGLQIAAAGLKQFGTEAGGRLLADPELLDAILRKLPPGWESKNLQVVLHTRVIGNAPSQPEVVAWRVW